MVAPEARPSLANPLRKPPVSIGEFLQLAFDIICATRHRFLAHEQRSNALLQLAAFPRANGASGLSPTPGPMRTSDLRPVVLDAFNNLLHRFLVSDP